MTTKKQTKRRNPPDSTMRNINALKKQVKNQQIELAGVDASFCLLTERLDELESNIEALWEVVTTHGEVLSEDLTGKPLEQKKAGKGKR